MAWLIKSKPVMLSLALELEPELELAAELATEADVLERTTAAGTSSADTDLTGVGGALARIMMNGIEWNGI